MKKMLYLLIALLISDILSLDAAYNRYNSMSMEASMEAASKVIATIAMAAATGLFMHLGIKAYGYLSNYFQHSTTGEVVVPEVKFSDIIGAQEAKEELQTIVSFLKTPEEFLLIGAQTPKGILLEGPPGNGKTLLAKALAGEAGVKFLAVDGASFNETWAGVGIAKIRALFEKARKNSPCIIFFDEIDGIGKRDPYPIGSVHEHNARITELLTQIDGIKTDAHRPVFIVAATNHRELIDEALIRSGRIDTTIVVKNPNVKDRKEMLEFYANKTKKEKPIINIDFNKLATQSENFSGADIANLVNKAKIFAVRKKHQQYTQEDFDEALQQIKGSKEKSPVKLSLPHNYRQHSNTISSITQSLIEKNQKFSSNRAGILFQ